MKTQKKIWWLCLCLGGLLLLGGCVRTGDGQEKEALDAEAGLQEQGVRDKVAMLAMFRSKDGDVFSRGSASISDGENSKSYDLDANGEILVPDLPREGRMLLCLYNEEGEQVGQTAVKFSVGFVIDASTDERGDGYVTLKQAQEEIALVFTLDGNGALACALRLLEMEEADEADRS